MSACNQENLVAALKVASVVSLGTYAGAGAAIACPVSLGIQGLEKASCRAKVLRSVLKHSLFFPVTSALAGASSIGAYMALHGTGKEDISLLVGAGAIASLFPYSYMFMNPINEKLLPASELSEEESGLLVDRWIKLHHLRSAVSLTAFGFVTYKLLTKS